MNYAWEAVLLAEQNGRDRGSLRFVEAVTPSPYIEVSVTDLNTGEPEGDRVEINPLYRLGDVFGRLFDRNTDQMVQTRALFFDVCMHYITQLDLREGLSKEDYHHSLLADDIRAGRYGRGGTLRTVHTAGAETDRAGVPAPPKDGKLPGVVPESSDGDVRGRVGVRE